MTEASIRDCCKSTAAWWQDALGREGQSRCESEIEAIVDSDVVRRTAQVTSLESVSQLCRDVQICVGEISRLCPHTGRLSNARTFGAGSSFRIAKIRAMMEALETLSIERPQQRTIGGSFRTLERKAVYLSLIHI